jgi:hypothetical protein
MQLGALHVPDNWKFTDVFNTKAPKGKVSAYLRNVVERDLSGEESTPNAISETILVTLCKTLRPEIAARLGDALNTHQIHQPALLAKILESLTSSLEAGDIIAPTPTPLVHLYLIPDTLEGITTKHLLSRKIKPTPNLSPEIVKLFNQYGHYPQAEEPSPMVAEEPPLIKIGIIPKKNTPLKQ